MTTTTTTETPTRTLVLHIAVPDIWADDLDESAEWFGLGEPTDADRAAVVSEWFDPAVVVSLVTVPGEKMQNDEAALIAREGRIVGAYTIVRTGS